jgi:CheY-like chemotaxis protein
MRESIEIIKTSGEKAAAIVQDLLTLARRNVVTREVIRLNDIIEAYMASPEHEKLMSFHRDSEVTLLLEPTLLPIKGSPIHITKTIMNLVSNGMEAMLTGGRLSISTANIHLDRPLNGYSDISVGDYVVLQFKDEGIGVSEDDKSKIFEPFYTKKRMGRSGTGLGMSVVWSTVKDHDGYIDLESREGQGSIFRLFFPVTHETCVAETPQATIDHIKGNGERLLIVDDQKDQRTIASAILGKLNYQPIAVDSGEAAVAFLEKNAVDLVILDMIMDPGIDGLETYQRIRRMRPGQRTIIASGFSETHRVKQAQALGARNYVSKPYTLEKIGVAIKHTLESQQEPVPVS